MLSLDGKIFTIPGVYGVLKIVQQGGTFLPIFNVGVIVSENPQGIPYTVGTGNTPLTADKFILPFTNITDMQKNCGLEGDCGGVTFMRYAKRAGAGTVYNINVRPLTKMSGGTVVNQDGSPVVALTYSSKKYGAPVNDTSITIAASIHTIIPPKNVTFLTADSGTGKTFAVGSVIPYKIGDTIFITSNAYAAPVSKIIESINTTTKEVTVTVAVAVSALATDYARIFQEDTDNKEVSVALTTRALVTAFYQTSVNLDVALATGVTVMPTTLAKAYIQNLTSATKATSPAATANDWQAVCDNFARWNNEFAVVNRTYMRIVGITTSDSANQIAFRDMAIARRAAGLPCAVVCGSALGDYLLSSSAEPKARTLALNNDSFQFAGFGDSGYGGNLSYAGYIFGSRMANNVNHNQTNDDLPFAAPEKAYSKEDVALVAYNAAGVMSIISTKTGYKMCQGLTTYQDQTQTFNPDTKQTYLVANRDSADFFLRAVIELLETINGTDGVTQEVISSALVKLGDDLIALGIITQHDIDSILKTGNAWNVKDTAKVESPTDFIGVTSTILVN